MLHISTQLENNVGHLLLTLETKTLKVAKLFNLVTQDEIGSNFSMQYLENQAYLSRKKLHFNGLGTYKILKN